jgi:hypothetical protein
VLMKSAVLGHSTHDDSVFDVARCTALSQVSVASTSQLYESAMLVLPMAVLKGASGTVAPGIALRDPSHQYLEV